MDRLRADDAARAAHRRINRTATPYPDDRSVPELFARQVARAAGATAVVHGRQRLTYRELDRAADVVAARLAAHGARPGDPVGVCVRRSADLVVALLAVLKCGAHYVPFEASWPDGRLNGLFEQAGATVLLTDRAGELTGRFPAATVVEVATRPGVEAPGPGVTVDPGTLAYVNFTSGSTGRPKGVPITHRGITRLVFGARYADLDSGAVVLHTAPVTFDAATFEIWGPLLHGGVCVLYPSPHLRCSELRAVLTEHGVTVVFLTTALFNTIIDEAPDTLDSVRTILTGGEAHSMRHIGAALARYGPGRLVSVYGPTECTTFATFHPVDALTGGEESLPIGRPIQNTRVYVVDGDELCAPGRTGEILLAGPGLSPGYLAAPELNRDRFLLRDVGGVPERLYRTGDRGALRADGVLMFHGRVDDQVKINGYRIELGEISYHLGRHHDVRQNFVTVVETAAGEKSLAAFVVTEDDRCTPAGLRDYLSGLLPGYMVPGQIRFCAELPLSATGKVDRRALLATAAADVR
ncbi:amino acid adenylation domain-containing protein [Actinoplanes sp. NPDC026670]|uniref:amino acid adenylation domain-containing protein n=1 Tax=Actinoplanes sp. NPDC026670 TaxID=3154700 RepID=UPI0033F37AB1